MRPRLEVVPRAARTAQGAGDKGLSRTGEHFTMNGTEPCHCGPGRSSSSSYTCLTCAGFARIGRRIEARAPHLHTEARRA